MSLYATLAKTGLALALSANLALADSPKFNYPDVSEVLQQLSHEKGTPFPVGSPNLAYEENFTGVSYLAALSEDKTIPIHNVTFGPGSINRWHIHHNTCQFLMGVAGSGYYQIWGQEPQKIEPGQSVTIPAGTKHWHGAAPTHWFQHLAYMRSGDDVSTEWLEPVNPEDYQKLE